MPVRAKTLSADTSAWEAYRLYQRDLLIDCFEDADHLMRRLRLPPTEEERRLIVSLLWDKRCQPWKYYRDEQRALLR